MRNSKKITLGLALITFSLIGCGKKGSSSKQVSTIPASNSVFIPGNQGLSPSQSTNPNAVLIDLSLSSESSADFSALSMELDLGNVIGNEGELDAKQGGDITIHKTYKNGQTGFSFFTSGGNLLEDVQENYWNYNSSGKLVWRGAFEGPSGTLVVVVDGVYESGDGTGPFKYMSGSVWFRKWPVVADTGINSQKCYTKNGRLDCKNPSGPLARCWKVSLGPYDCRFKVSADSKNVEALGNRYTSEAYVKIGTFIDLNREHTFKINY